MSAEGKRSSSRDGRLRFFLDKVERRRKRRPGKANSERRFPQLLKAAPKYDEVVPLYELWKEYATALVGVCRERDERLLKLDLHGALLLVTKAKPEGQEGLHGIVVREAKNVFYVVTRQDRLLCLPKQGSEFSFILGGRVFRLFGDNLRHAPSVRIQKKLKNTILPRLIL